MFEDLERINQRPRPFEFYTAEDLWTEEHTSRQMLSCHLNPDIDVSSRRREFIDRSVAWIASHFHVGSETRIADFGCGPGLYTSRLARLGAMVTGIDFSKTSIGYAREEARREGLDVDYVRQNYLEYEGEGGFDLVLMIMCDFCVLSPAQRRTMLAKFRGLLRPGGAVLLDAYTLAAFSKRREGATYAENLMGGFWSASKYFGFLNTFRYEEEKVVLDKYTLVEAQRTRVVYNWLQYYSPHGLREVFEEAGFSVETLLADVAGSAFDETADELAVVARKP